MQGCRTTRFYALRDSHSVRSYGATENGTALHQPGLAHSYDGKYMTITAGHSGACIGSTSLIRAHRHNCGMPVHQLPAVPRMGATMLFIVTGVGKRPSDEQQDKWSP